VLCCAELSSGFRAFAVHTCHVASVDAQLVDLQVGMTSDDVDLVLPALYPWVVATRLDTEEGGIWKVFVRSGGLDPDVGSSSPSTIHSDCLV
jgi:hypothetical protein